MKKYSYILKIFLQYIDNFIDYYQKCLWETRTFNDVTSTVQTYKRTVTDWNKNT